MDKKTQNKWIMYYEIHKLSALGFSRAKIASHLVVDARTVKKYLQMSEGEYERFLLSGQERNKSLSGYEGFVRDRLDRYPDTSCAQMHDWLKEHHADLPEVSPRTVYNFVMYVRGKYNIPIAVEPRQYFPVEQMAYGHQAQVDFGVYNMRYEQGARKKVWFFAMVLSRSRMKYIWFSEVPFTSHSVCEAHERAFGFYGGIPGSIVYDQDRVMVVEENMGNVILTAAFQQYSRSRSFKLHFCRKADPQSKGKVENVIQYVKKNFLYNRAYVDIETLNNQAVAWLARTANCLEHHSTKKSPESEFLIEKEHLAPYRPMALAIESNASRHYQVRKDNTIAYKSNFYSLPMGTYKGPNTKVILRENKGILAVYDLKNSLLASHTLFTGKGKTIRNTHHKRDTSKSLEEMTDQVAACFTDKQKAIGYLAKIKQEQPRYIRDHLQLMRKALQEVQKNIADKTLDFCIENNNFRADEFQQVLNVLSDQDTQVKNQIKLLDPNNLKKASQHPQVSDIEDYQNIINQSK